MSSIIGFSISINEIVIELSCVCNGILSIVIQLPTGDLNDFNPI